MYTRRKKKKKKKGYNRFDTATVFVSRQGLSKDGHTAASAPAFEGLSVRA